jgi:hypothetical protein
LRDAPRAIDGATRLAILLKGDAVWMSCLMMLVGLLFGAEELERTGAAALLFDGVEVPAVVESVEVVRRSSKNGAKFDWQIRAAADVDGDRVVAHGTLSSAAAVGEPVMAFVPHKRPDLAVAYRRGGPSLVGVVAFAIAGLAGVAVFAVALVRNVRDLRVLRHGRLSEGKLVEKIEKPHSRGVNWTLVFSYPTTSGQQRTTVQVENANVDRLVDAEREPLVYDPRAPAYAVLLDALPDHVRVDDDGALTPVPWRRGLVRALPMAAVVVALLYALAASRLL